MPRPVPAGKARQGKRFKKHFDRLEKAFSVDNSEISLRQDPAGIAPERAMVFVTAVSINDFVKAAQRIGLDILSELDLEEDYELPTDLIGRNADTVNPTLYATMPTTEALEKLLKLWRAYQRNEQAETGYAPWWTLFNMLAELRPWGPEDRLSRTAREVLKDRLPLNDDDEVRIELEIWPTTRHKQRQQWRYDTEKEINALGGRVICASAINDRGFVYEALLVGMSAGTVREMLDNPASPSGLATLDGIQFILPQTIAQSVPDLSEPIASADTATFEPFDTQAPIRAILLDGTPLAGHGALDGGVVIEDVHDLVARSQVKDRHHATSMASLILRGDLEADGVPVDDSRLISIPVLIDTEGNATSPDDRLFVDVVYQALVRAFGGDEPLAPDAFLVNFSVGIHGSHFVGRIGALARLIDWYSATYGVLFIVSAGNNSQDLLIPNVTLTAFEDMSIDQRRARIKAAQRQTRHTRTLMAPSEAINALTVGAISGDIASSTHHPASSREIAIQEPDATEPALSSAIGLGAFRSIKPDVLNIGGWHGVRSWPLGGGVRLQLISNTQGSGLCVAASRQGRDTQVRSRGTSCAAALTTRAHLAAAAALTQQDGPYAGQELPRRDLALLTRALAVNSARWPDNALDQYKSEKERLERLGGNKALQAKEEVARYFGYGVLRPDLMCEAPRLGTTLVGLGTVRKDGAAIFDMPLPHSLSGERIHRAMLVTLAWFSPVEPARASYRLVALDAVAADGSDKDDIDKGWGLAMKSGHLDVRVIKRGTVWSQRLAHNRVAVPDFDEHYTLPIQVRCRDASGNGLNPDEDIRFALAVTFEVAVETEYDIHEEIRQQLQVRLRDGYS